MKWIMSVNQKCVCTMVTLFPYRKAEKKKERKCVSLFQWPNILDSFKSFVWFLRCRDVAGQEILLKDGNSG